MEQTASVVKKKDWMSYTIKSLAFWVVFAIIAGIALCLMLFIAEAVHIQQLAEAANSKDQVVLHEILQPIASRYTWSRILVIVVMIFWSTAEYRKTKKQLGL